jgi:hypothetical protein
VDRLRFFNTDAQCNGYDLFVPDMVSLAYSLRLSD